MNTHPIVSTHIDISATDAPAPELELDEDLTAAVRSGDITLRRANAIQAARVRDYTELAPEVAAKVASGEITEQQAQDGHCLALLLVGFIATEANRPQTRAMFEANDAAHFIEGMQSDPGLRDRFVAYVAGVAA